MSFHKRFHVLGVPHTVSNTDFNACAYTMKVINFCKMMKSMNHTVYHYGAEGADVEADECVDVISKEKLYNFYGYKEDNWKQKQFKHNIGDEVYTEFNNNCKLELSKRLDHMDFVISLFGSTANWVMKDLPISILSVEAGLGHTSGEAAFKVFESHSIMAQHYGKRSIQHPHKHDTAIQNYFDLSQFVFDLDKREEISKQNHNEGYWLVVGRIIHCKGGDIAYGAAKMTGSNIKFAGQSSDGYEELNELCIPHDDPSVEYIGHVDIKRRNELMSSAKGLIICSRYLEPFGGVAIEAMLLGVPVIASNRGSFPENIIQGMTGFLVHDHYHMITAMLCCAALSPKFIREYAEINFSLEHVKHRYEEFFDRIYLYKLYGSNVTPTIGRVKQLDIFGRTIPDVPYAKSKQIESYTYQFGYFGIESVKAGYGTGLYVSPVPPAVDMVDEDKTGIFQADHHVDPKVFDFYHSALVPDDLYNAELENQKIHPKMLSTFDQFKSWLYSENPNIERKIKEVHFHLNPYILERIIETFSPEVIFVYNPGADLWKIFGYRQEIKEGQPLKLIKDASVVPKINVAIWTENQWALGRIAQGLKKYSKRTNIDIIDWDDRDRSIKFWKEDWKKYNVITGNSHITSNEFITKEHINLLRPTVHCPLIDHDHYREILEHYSDYMSAISEETKDVLVKTLTKPKLLFLTRPGVDTELFSPVGKEIKQIKNIGFIGLLDVKSIHPDADTVKRPDWAIKIAEYTGCELVEIFGNDLTVGADMFKDIDLVISCSNHEGGPLGLFEAAASKVGILTTKVGNIQTLNTVKTYETSDEAIRIIKDWNENIETYNEYVEKVHDEVVNEWCWEKRIDEWESFFLDRTPLKDTQPTSKPVPNFESKGSIPITDPDTIQKIKDIMAGKRAPDKITSNK